jgi:AbrB family looped-hinge helix DNA binding protein
MIHTLTVSSQGQIVIPSAVRKHLGITPGSKVAIRVVSKGKIPTATLEPVVSWTKRIKGIAKGMYGKGERYIEKERKSWEKK